MESYGYAVLYKKVKIDSHLYYFKPLYVVEGIYNKIQDNFVDEVNVIRYLYTNKMIFAEDIETCIGEVYTKEELKKFYPEMKEIDALKMNLFKNMEAYFIIGIVSNDTINIHKIDMNKNQVTAVEPIKNSDASTFYKTVFNHLGFDFTIFLKEDIMHMMSMTDIDECKSFIKQIKNDKTSYYHKVRSANKNEDPLIIPDEWINFSLLTIEDIEKLKSFFQEAYLQQLDEYETKSNHLDNFSYLSIDELRTNEETTLDYITNNHDIKQVLNELRKMCSYYEDALVNAKSFRQVGVSFDRTEAYFRARIADIHGLLEEQDLETIRNKYLTIYEKSSKQINEIDEEFQTNIEKEHEEVKQIKTQNIKQISKSIDHAMKKFNQLVGLENMKEIFEEIFSLVLYKMKTSNHLDFEPDSMHTVFTGNPGTGKTTVAEIIAPLFHELGYVDSPKVTYIAAQDIVGQYVGQTAPKTEALIKKNRGGVIVLDEAYILAGKAQNFGNEAVTVLLKEMEKNRTLFIFAGYKKEMESFIKMNSGLRSRIGTYISFEDYTEEQLLEILMNTIKNTSSQSIDHQLVFTNEAIERVKEILHDVVGIKDFGNGRFVKKLFNHILRTHAKNTRDTILEEELYIVTEKDIPDDIMERILFENSASPYSSTNAGFNAKIKENRRR